MPANAIFYHHPIIGHVTIVKGQVPSHVAQCGRHTTYMDPALSRMGCVVYARTRPHQPITVLIDG